MPRTRLGFPVATQTHLERVDSRHWRLVISDGVLFFKAAHVRQYLLSEKALKKLQKQIQDELKD